MVFNLSSCGAPSCKDTCAPRDPAGSVVRISQEQVEARHRRAAEEERAGEEAQRRADEAARARAEEERLLAEEEKARLLAEEEEEEERRRSLREQEARALAESQEREAARLREERREAAEREAAEREAAERRRRAQEEAERRARSARVVEFLKAQGFAGVNAGKRKMLRTTYPLHRAAELGDEKMVEALLAEGADASQKNSSGKTAAQVAGGKNKKGSHSGALRVLGGA